MTPQAKTQQMKKKTMTLQEIRDRYYPNLKSMQSVVDALLQDRRLSGSQYAIWSVEYEALMQDEEKETSDDS